MRNVSLFFVSLIFLLFVDFSSLGQEKIKFDDWKLGLQAWTMKHNTFEETLQKMNKMGLKYLEAFPGQIITSNSESRIDVNMSQADKELVKGLLKKYNVEMVSFGVVVYDPLEPGKLEEYFQFAKDMGLSNLAMEPVMEQIPIVSELADKYQINVGLHNHPKPTRYWHPDSVITATKGMSSRIGAVADVGHWLESGMNPIPQLKRLEGSIKEFHLKDENRMGTGDYLPEGLNYYTAEGGGATILPAMFYEMLASGIKNVPFGQGVINMAGIMAEMKRQNYKGYFFIEYEYNFGHNDKEVELSVKFFNEIKRALLNQ